METSDIIVIGVVILVFLIVIANTTNSPMIQNLGNGTVEITTSKNINISPSEFIDKANASIPEVQILSTVKSQCRWHIYPYQEDLYTPEYYIFSPTYAPVTQSCSCPDDMYMKTAWKYYMFGYLYQPEKALNVSGWVVPFQQCLATNCYTSGLLSIGSVTHLDPTTSWQKKYDANASVYVGATRYDETFSENNLSAGVDGVKMNYSASFDCAYPQGDLVVFNGQVKHHDAYNKVTSAIERAKGDFKYRVESREEILSSIDAFLNDTVADCRVDGNYVSCDTSQPIPQIQVYLKYLEVK